MAADLGVLSRLGFSCHNWSLLSELALTGRFFNANEAKELGLIY